MSDSDSSESDVGNRYVRDRRASEIDRELERVQRQKQESSNRPPKTVDKDKESRRRFIFNRWPRAPDGGTITPENAVIGKLAPGDLQLWGETLNDFHIINRYPLKKGEKSYLITITTSSKMLGWCEKNNENYAIDEMAEARMEADPTVVEPYDIARLIRDHEKAAFDYALESGLKDLVPRPSISAPRYPMPWPRVPFSRSMRKWPQPPMLEKLLPLSSLPTTLVVHDPWGTVDGHYKSRRHSWKPPMRGTKALRYRLQLSSAGEQRIKDEQKAAQEKKDAETKILETFLADPHTRNQMPKNGLVIRTHAGSEADVEPPIFCLLSAPPAVDPNEPAHLRISPSHHLGSGNHSVLYDAEYEVPRDLLVPRPFCDSCVFETAIRIRDEEDSTSSGDKPTNATGDDMLADTKVPDKDSEPALNPSTGKEKESVLQTVDKFSWSDYKGPIRVVCVDVHYFKPFDEPCRHFVDNQEEIRKPPTATVRVAAKLSKQGDNHLKAEARNYEAFPLYFFQHWNGLVIPPSQQHPVPVGAMAPQYYGYYVFDALVDDDDPIAQGPLPEQGVEMDTSDTGGKKDVYRSPILLMELCGTPINGDELCVDDREEAISLFNRFHCAGWTHQSLYQRNIVRKPGPISAHPDERLLNSQSNKGMGENWTFRMIDYGRSRNFEDEKHPCYDGRDYREVLRVENNKLWNWLSFNDYPAE
ncbi:hypothetical protein CVT24_005582 [Panaeolus cyanescens]|uniref:Protein kinase domain-containing protein n=1 Tax=Panaeolus cyanescens TaxID=181874 RepID=A0A409VQL0_9AGAR|nr:hypothetical protein CVT24_005582 [Panaeolus cyanescens]